MFSVLVLCVAFAHSVPLGGDNEEFDPARLNFTDAEQRREFEETARFAHHLHRFHKTERYVIEGDETIPNPDSELSLHTPSPDPHPGLSLHTPVAGYSSSLSPYQRRIAQNLPTQEEEEEARGRYRQKTTPTWRIEDRMVSDPKFNSQVKRLQDPNLKPQDPKLRLQDPNSASPSFHFDAEPTLPKVLRDFHPLRLDIKTRVKRFHIDQSVYWDSNNITWSLFTKVLPPNLTRNEVSQEIHDAFMIWQKTTSWQKNETILYFTQLNDDVKSANIRISFAKGDHQDKYPFDGPGSVLAHAWFPKSGVVHLDVEERWQLTDDDNENGTYLLPVVAHEIGHALGLQHSSVKQAMMYSWYSGRTAELAADDRNGIEQLYVSNPHRNGRTTTSTTTQRPPTTKSVDENNLFKPLPEWVMEEMPNSLLEMCAKPPDTVARLRKEYYVFVEGAFWRYRDATLEQSNLLAENVRVSDMWGGLCGVDAMCEVAGKIMFVHNGVWYEYSNRKLVGAGVVDDMFVPGGGKEVTALFHEQGWLYMVGNNGYVYRVDVATKKVQTQFRFRDKFRGVGRRIKWVTSDEDGAKEVGVGRGVWRMKVVANRENLGYVYEADGDIAPLLQTC